MTGGDEVLLSGSVLGSGAVIHCAGKCGKRNWLDMN